MKKLLRASGLFFSLSVLQPFGPWAAGHPLVVATYNVANYTLAGRMVGDGGYLRGYPKTEREKTALRAVIKALDADILALQEMGTRPFLDELRRDLRSEGVDYPHGEVLGAADADRHVAVLSRRPFSLVRGHTDLDFPYFGKTESVKRGMLEVRVATGSGGELAFFIVHLKSRLTDRADDPESAIRRGAEAVAVRDRVLELFPTPSAPSARFMILGDCNDSHASRPLQHLMRRGKLEICGALPGGDSRGEVWTHFFAKQGSYSRVDHMLVSPALRPFVTGGAVRVYDGPGANEASDHRPVVARLDVD